MIAGSDAARRLTWSAEALHRVWLTRTDRVERVILACSARTGASDIARAAPPKTGQDRAPTGPNESIWLSFQSTVTFKLCGPSALELFTGTAARAAVRASGQPGWLETISCAPPRPAQRPPQPVSATWLTGASVT